MKWIVKNSDLHGSMCLIECFKRDTMMASTNPISHMFGQVTPIKVTGKIVISCITSAVIPRGLL